MMTGTAAFKGRRGKDGDRGSVIAGVYSRDVHETFTSHNRAGETWRGRPPQETAYSNTVCRKHGRGFDRRGGNPAVAVVTAEATLRSQSRSATDRSSVVELPRSAWQSLQFERLFPRRFPRQQRPLASVLQLNGSTVGVR
jgi:hypothetical protein